ncbi:MAG: hypothetical protein VX460_00100 [Planctomycetota bacterium]|nr:hypothetical protein [Planctomycetota bacterium]
MSGALLCLLCAVNGWASAPAAHPNSYSLSEVQVRGRSVRVELRLQVLSLGEVIEGFDRDLDGHAEDGEIAANEAAILDYVHEHYRLMAGPIADSGALDPSERLAIRSGSVSEGPLALDPMNEVSEWVDVVLEYDLSAMGEFRALGVTVDLFADTSPGHNDSAAVTWNGVELGPWMFNAAASGHLFEATDAMLERNAPAFGRFLRRAAAESLGRWRLALLAALLVVGSRRTAGSPLFSCGLLAAATAGGVATGHLVPAGFELAGFAALTLPLALAYLALDDLIHSDGRSRVLEPVVFGAVAGVGISLELAPDVATEAQQVGARAGAACGVAASLMAASALVILAALALRRGVEQDAFATRPLRVCLSVPALVLGVMGFLKGAL